MKTSKLFLLTALLAVAAVTTSVVDYYTRQPVEEEPVAWSGGGAIPSPESLVQEGSCVSALLGSSPKVNGLDHGIDLPLFVGARRLSYPPTGASQYIAKAAPQDVAGFYQDRMQALCWRVRERGHNRVVYEKDNKVVQISIYDNPLSGKSVIDYQVLQPGRVLGVATVQAAQTTCPSDQVSCTDQATGHTWCQVPPCPSSTPPPSPTPSPSPSPSPTPTPPPSSTTCSGTYQQPGATYPSCNYSTCPNGCNWDSQGCPSGCYTSSTPPPSPTPSPSPTPTPPPSSTTCSGTYQQPGATYPSCNYSTCPNGCNWDSQGCPSGCYTQPTCTGQYQQSGASYPSCNNSVCPNGCNWSNGCPSGCYTPATCSGQYQQSGVTSPSCNYSTCPSGCNYGSDGCPSGCYTSSSTGSCQSGYQWCPSSYTCLPSGSPCGGSSSCPSGQYWCSSTNTCKPTSDTYCPSSGSSGYYPDKSSCESAGGRWCQPTISPHCHGPGDPAPCESDTPGGGYACPAGQYTCNGACVSTNTPCSPAQWPNTQADCGSQGKYWCTPSSGGYGWCQSSPCGNTGTTTTTACSGNTYYCEYSHSCVPSGSTCGSTPPSPGTCPQGQYWCSYSNGCVSNNISCMPPPSNPTPFPPPQQCPQGYYWCDGSHSCVSNREPCVQTNLPPGPGGPSEEEMKRWEEQQKKMQKEQERQQFKMMKQNIKQFEREMKRMTQYVTSMEKRLKRQNIGLPQELQNALTEIPGLTAQLKAAEDFEQFEEAMSKMQDVMMVIQDWSGRLHELEQLGQMLKDVQRQVNDMYRSFKQLQARLKRRPELQEELKSLEAMVGVMSRRVTDAKALAKTDSEEALNKVREVFDNTEEFWSEYQFLQMVSDLQKGLSMADSELRRAKSRVRKLERTKGADPALVQEAKAILAEIEAMLPELKALVKKKPIDIDELRDKAETFWDAIQRFEETMAQGGVGIYYSPSVYAPSSQFEIDIPEGFIMPQSAAGPEGLGGGFGSGSEFGAPSGGFGGGGPSGFPGSAGGFPPPSTFPVP